MKQTLTQQPIPCQIDPYFELLAQDYPRVDAAELALKLERYYGSTVVIDAILDMQESKW